MASGGFDFRAVRNLQRQIEKLEREQDAFCRECANELAARLLGKAKRRTPTRIYPSGSGQSGGTLKRNWTIGEIRRTGDSYEVEIINPTDYASYVEYGHRKVNHRGWVPGKFMMTISEQQIQKAAPKIIEKKLRTWLRGAMDV